jgi:hypothetical protein
MNVKLARKKRNRDIVVSLAVSARLPIPACIKSSHSFSRGFVRLEDRFVYLFLAQKSIE